MDKSNVALIRCSTYDPEEVFAAVRNGVELLGGVKRFAAGGEKLLLKPNVLAGTKPEECVCTHPSVVKAVGRLFQEVSRNICYGDSSAHGRPAEQLYAAGISQAAEEIGLPQADFDQGRSVDGFVIAKGALEADGIINLPKLKTHFLTRMTGAVKNLYGCVPGFYIKKSIHVRHPTAQDFSRMLVALNLLLKPRLHIMDGIMAMEGNGPRTGDPSPMGVLLFSTDPVALDAVMCALVELNPLYVPSARPGRAWGLGTYKLEEIQIVGASLASARNGDFHVWRGPVLDVSQVGLLTYVNNLIGQRAVLDKDKCTRCGLCVQVCPVQPKALDWHDGNKKKPPSYRYLRCIRCFCCQEICPQGAISVKSTVLKL